MTPARRWPRVLGIAGLAMAIAGLVLIVGRDGDPPGGPDPLHPSLAPFFPLEPAKHRHEVVSDAGKLGRAVRLVVGPEARGGVWWTRIEIGREQVVVEWVRAGGTDAAPSLLCGWRSIGGTDCQLEPPMPVLQGPLAPEATWSWRGTVDGLPGEADFRITRRATTPAGELLQVEQRTRVAGHESVQTRTYAAGVGLVATDGSTADPDWVGVTHAIRAQRVD